MSLLPSPSWRLLEVSSSGGWRGAEQHQLELFQGFRRRRLSFRVAVSQQKEGFFRELHAARVPYTKFPLRGKVNLSCVLQLAHYIRQRGFSLVHTHLSTASTLGGLAGRLAGVPVVATVHNLTNRFSHGNYLFAHYLIAVSWKNRRELIKRGVSPSRIACIPNGTDLQRFSDFPSREEARAALKLPPHLFCMGNIGTFSKRKNLSLLLRAFALFQKRHPNAYCLLVGGGGEIEALRALSRSLRVEKKVLFVDFVPDVRAFYAALDCFVLTSRAEGGPRTVLEAMACGLPVIATDVGAVREMLGFSARELLIAQDNVGELVRKLEKVFSEPGFAAQQGAYLKERAKKFSAEVMVEKTLQFFSQIVRKERAR